MVSEEVVHFYFAMINYEQLGWVLTWGQNLIWLQHSLDELEGDVVLQVFSKCCEEEQALLYYLSICLLQYFYFNVAYYNFLRLASAYPGCVSRLSGWMMCQLFGCPEGISSDDKLGHLSGWDTQPTYWQSLIISWDFSLISLIRERVLELGHGDSDDVDDVAKYGCTDNFDADGDHDFVLIFRSDISVAHRHDSRNGPI